MTSPRVLPLRHGDALLGFLWVIVGDRPLSDAERAALARGAGEVADHLRTCDEAAASAADGRCCERYSRARCSARSRRCAALAGDGHVHGRGVRGRR